MRRLLQWGGLAAGVILIAFGIASIALSIAGRNTVTDSLKQEQITGTPDMTPDAIAEEAEKAGLKDVDLPDCDVAGEPIDTGSEAKCFAEYMRIHALEATGGKTYSQMGRFLTESGQETNDVTEAAKDENGQPKANGARDLWVTETALATALNVSYMADQLGLFGLVVGVALLLAGIGFVILALAVLGGRFAEPPPA